MTEDQSIKKSQSENAVSAIILCLGIGAGGILLFCLQASHLYQFASIFAEGLLIAVACMLSGALLGFLFGIPRTMQQEKSEKKSAATKDKDNEETEENGTSYKANTNLEQISDWLTKILVGIGLTKIATLPKLLENFADFASPGLGDFPASKTFSIGILFVFLICGFLISYLWTRLYFAGALRRADLDTIGAKLSKIENKFTEIQRQTEIDAKALNIVQHQLNPGPGSPPLNQNDLNDAIEQASKNIKIQIYYIAHGVRSQNWKSRETKPLMEKTIPIFRALIASDKDDVYHLNHGQLAFALKDQRQPDYQQAVEELTKAIELRGPAETNGWLLYEFNRAICRINLDVDFPNNEKSKDESRANIIRDITSARRSGEIKEMINRDPQINEFLSLNT